MQFRLLFFILVFCSGLSASVRAEVASASGHGFSTRHEVIISAGPEAVFQAIVSDVHRWWDARHTYSGTSAHLSIEAKPGGCFCEQLDGGAVRHMTVEFVTRPKSIRMSGGLGPLQELGVAGSMTWQLVPEGRNTKLTLSYNVGGYRDGGLDHWAGPVDGVLGGQLERLKKYVETGNPE